MNKANREWNRKIKLASNKILTASLSIFERENNSDTSELGVNHLTIIGGIRRVELYFNGTVYANKVKDKFKKINIKGLCFNEAIDKAIKVAKKGYA